jgi:predicted nucleotidyltransferase
MIDATEKQVQIILTILKQFVPDCEVRVFGSRYNGNVKEYSDLDLTIVGKEKLDWKILADIKEAFEESDLPFRVDLLDWNAISLEFRKVIVERGFEVFKMRQDGSVMVGKL